MEIADIAMPAYLPAPLTAAPGIPDYPQFTPTPVPANSNAVRAWSGTLQPFADDDAARNFLHCVESRLPFDVFEGRITAPSHSPRCHWADRCLIGTNLRFHLVILEFGGTRHPHAYCLQPEISYDAHPLHPHLRPDRLLAFGHQPLPALCVYSGAEFKYSPEWPRMVQFLDQVSAYLGRHIIWMRTRIVLPERFGERPVLPTPGDVLFDFPPGFHRDAAISRAARHAPRCVGYWPGAVASTGAQQHLKSIKPSQECWCWSGKRYSECHRNSELQLISLKAH